MHHVLLLCFLTYYRVIFSKKQNYLSGFVLKQKAFLHSHPRNLHLRCFLTLTTFSSDSKQEMTQTEKRNKIRWGVEKKCQWHSQTAKSWEWSGSREGESGHLKLLAVLSNLAASQSPSLSFQCVLTCASACQLEPTPTDMGRLLGGKEKKKVSLSFNTLMFKGKLWNSIWLGGDMEGTEDRGGTVKTKHSVSQKL